ncbi:hypothetical protein ES705_25247 [subsurface metagenome]
MKIGSLIASDTTTINLTWLPQYIYFIASTVLTGFKVTVFGDGIISDLDGDGLDTFGQMRMLGLENGSYLIPLSNGIIKNKNIEIICTNPDVAAVDVYGICREEGDVYVQTLRQQVLAYSGADFTDFAYLGFPSAADGDKFTVTFEDGTVHDFDRKELVAMLGMTQVTVASKYLVDNLDGEIRKINFIPAAAQTVYMMRYTPLGDVAGGVFQASL